LEELPAILDISQQLIAALKGVASALFENNGRTSMELDKK